jgi:hypothetical protein
VLAVVLIAYDQPLGVLQPDEPAIDEALIAALGYQDRAGAVPPASGMVAARLWQV